MAITSITIQQDNRIGSANLLATHNPLTFIANVNYSGLTPDLCNVEVYDSERNLLDTYSAIPYKDILLTQRQFIFKANTIVKSLMNSFDDTPQLSDILVYVEGLTKQLYIRFVSPDNPLIYAETLIDFAHAYRQFGEKVCMLSQFNNDEDTYYAPKDKPCYVYFYNDNESNVLSLSPVTFERVEFDQNPLYFGYVSVGNDIEKSVVVNGYDITGDVVLNAPSGFQISLVSGSGFGPNVTIPFGGATFTTTVYLLFTPTTVKSYNNQIVPIIDGSPGVNILQLMATSKLKSEVLTGRDDWICPIGITLVDIECYGAGGRGADMIGDNNEGGGGAGGQYAFKANYAVTPGLDYPYQGGFFGSLAADRDSWFDDPNAALAKGGADSTIYSGIGGIGSSSGGIGDVVNAGGSGGNASSGSNIGGGGGGAGGPGGAGTSGSGQNFGTGNGGVAGNGGYGGDVSNPPVIGQTYGGGGGGNGKGEYPTEYRGASGGLGAVVLTYGDYD